MHFEVLEEIQFR